MEAQVSNLPLWILLSLAFLAYYNYRLRPERITRHYAAIDK